MVEPHVAGLARPRVQGLGLFEGMPRMAGIALGISIPVLTLLFGAGFRADLMAARTSFVSPAHNSRRLMGPHGHGGAGDPREIVLSGLELVHLLFFTSRAGLGRGQFCQFRVVHLFVVRSMAGGTINAGLRHLAFEILLDNAGRHLFVTVDTGALRSCRKSRTAEQKNTSQDQDSSPILHRFLLSVGEAYILKMRYLLSSGSTSSRPSFSEPSESLLSHNVSRRIPL